MVLVLSICWYAAGGHTSLGGQQRLLEAQQHAEQGLKLSKSGDLDKAEVELRQAVALSPNDPFYLGSLGGILGMQHKLEESSRLFERALTINPQDWATRRNLASNQFQSGKLQAAKQNLEMVLKSRPGDQTATLLLGMVAEELKDYASAVRYLELAPELVRQRPESIVALARSYYNTGASPKARAILARLDKQRFGSEGVFLGAQSAALAGDFDTAERLYTSIRSEYPDPGQLDYELALAAYRANRIDESLATLRKLTDQGHQTSDVFNLMAWCFHKQGNLNDAVAAMDLAIERDPARESNYLDLGMILLSHKRFSVALEAANKAVAVAPDSYQAHMLRGLVEARMSHLNEAEQAYAHAVELNPNAPEGVLALALVESAREKKQESEATFTKGLRKFPGNPVLYQEYGRMLLKFAARSDPAAKAKAASLFQTALSLDGSLAESHYQLGDLALNDGDVPAAVAHLEAAARLNPKSSKTQFVLARTYRRLGRSADASRAVASFQKLKAEEEQASSGVVSKGDRPPLPDVAATEPGGSPRDR